jgi:hypothetical protein
MAFASSTRSQRGKTSSIRHYSALALEPVGRFESLRLQNAASVVR